MRIHLFEFHDSPFCPSFIREAIVETLGQALRWGPITRAFVPAFEHFILQVGACPVVELCSGSGRTADHLMEILGQRGKILPQITLTDIFPNVAALERIKRRHPETIRYLKKPLDALTMIPQLGQQGNVSVMILNAFHHFRPQEARKVLHDCIEQRLPVFIQESFPRNPLRLFSMLHLLFLSVLLVPFATTRDRWLKLIGIIFPLIPLMGLWDGFISAMRIHSEQELREMVKGSEDRYHWVYEEVPFHPLGKATLFYGIPIEVAAPQ